MKRIDLYLQSHQSKTYENTKAEDEMVDKVDALYNIALSYQQKDVYVNTKNLKKWRKAYLGTLNALDKNTGEESERQSKPLRKLVYELIESKVDTSIPMPKLSPRRKTDLFLVDVTENYLKFEMDKMLSEQENDRSERATYIDGTSWYKVSWDSLDSSAERNGDLRVDVLLADQVVPEPGCKDYRQMNYCFERSSMNIATIYDLYGKIITASDNSSMVETISYYYKNEHGIVGRLIYAIETKQVITWEEDWQIRKIRVCKNCETPNAIGEVCPMCGHEKFKYNNVEEEVLREPLMYIENPYEVEESEETQKVKEFLPAGAIVPFYKIRQLPFVPRLSINSLDSLYGVSEVSILLDMQDSVNKILTKIEDKVLKSGSIVTKPHNLKISNADDSFKILNIKSTEQSAMIQTKPIIADVSQDLASAQLFYESARASSGVTESYQGKVDRTAISGKAKEISALQSANRLGSLRVMKNAAFAGVYELMLKYLLAFSDETRRFVKMLPDGQEEEMLWNKYMFLRKDDNGRVYYTDDFAFSTDPAATLSNNRVQMWQETLQQFMMGTFGASTDLRTLEVYWNIMASMQYPLAKTVLSGIKENNQHLPPDLEQALMQNPELLEMAASLVGEKRGGANSRASGRAHAGSVEKNNEEARMKPESSGVDGISSMQGGML